MTETRIRFDRSLKDARPFEMTAFESVRWAIFDQTGDFSIFQGMINNTKISSQKLHGGSLEEDLSVLFACTDVGGSGSTIYYFLALRRTNHSFSLALKFSTDEAGTVYISENNTETGFSAIGWRDRKKQQEYSYDKNISGYAISTAE